MAKVYLISYRFVKPDLLSEREFLSYKQMYNSGIPFEIAPRITFWSEFPVVKWCLIALAVSLPFAGVFEPLGFVAAISFFILFMNVVLLLHAASSFSSFAKTKNKYYEGLKRAIISSSSYLEFYQKAINL